MTAPKWIQVLTDKERSEYARAKERRDKCVAKYREVYIKLKRRADNRIHRYKEAQKNE